MTTTNSRKRPIENSYVEISKIIGSFSEFGLISYVTKRDGIRGGGDGQDIQISYGIIIEKSHLI